MILNSHPDILEAAVVGVPQPGRAENDVPFAFVIPRSNMLSKKNVNDFLDARVSDFKRLRGGLVFVDSIDKVT